jgi:hypothetical protein
METNKIFGKDVIQDANNHLLNSFLGRLMYQFAGPHFFALRVPTVLAFALYFWGIYEMVKSMQVRLVKFLVFLALVTVAYVNDYFAYTRGYGLGMAFFSWILVFCFRWIRDPNLKNLSLLYVCCWLAIFANLTFLLSACISIGIALLIYLVSLYAVELEKTFHISVGSLAIPARTVTVFILQLCTQKRGCIVLREFGWFLGGDW